MKKIFVSLSLFLIVLGVGVIYYPQLVSEGDIKAETKIYWQAQTPQVQAPSIQESEPVPSCFVWGPFAENNLVRVRHFLTKTGLIEKIVIQDRFLPDQFIVYLGPFPEKTSVRAFVKQFKQQGFNQVRPILRGPLSYGVEIASFETRVQAEQFLAGEKSPNMAGIRITNRFGEPSDEVDIVIKDLSPVQEQELVRASGQFSATRLNPCDQP